LAKGQRVPGRQDGEEAFVVVRGDIMSDATEVRQFALGATCLAGYSS